MKIAIISHTEHYRKEDGTIVGWGPTIKEINHLLDIAESIIHIAPLHITKAPNSALSYVSNAIEFIPLKVSGGKGLHKFSILYTAPYNIFKICNSIKDVDYIQFRAPTGIGIYVLPFLKFFIKKKYWVKYAGNWKDKKMPLGNKLQKKWLQNYISITTKVTVNGDWKEVRSNIIPFENPCLDHNDRESGNNNLKTKELTEKIDFCFVGALNKHKGVDKILNAFSNIDSDKIGTIHFVGDSIEKEIYVKLAEKIKYKTIFYGFLPKNEIKKIYSMAHFILLPSKSEGFPKVIGEAMNYGCIPIVSDISCIHQYISDGLNGFLINPNTVINLQLKVEEALKLSNVDYKKIIKVNYEKSIFFTYDHYNSKLLKEILN